MFNFEGAWMFCDILYILYMNVSDTKVDSTTSIPAIN